MSTWSMINLQDANSPMMENLIFFHNHSMMILLIITINIIYIMMTLLINKLSNKLINQNQMLEIIWTILPMMILLYIAIPSLKILYLSEELIKPSLTVKTIGHQWYWKYEYSNILNKEFDSFMILSKQMNSFRLLDVDNRLILPFKNQIRLLISSNDVIHSWTIPSIGVKADAIPGRINQIIFYMNRPGLFFGQCSEICGMNHSFMPISIESTNIKMFIKWIKN